MEWLDRAFQLTVLSWLDQFTEKKKLRPAHYATFDKLFILVFAKNYQISWQLLIDIVFVYGLISQF